MSNLLSTAGQVLVLVAIRPELRVRDIAAQIDVTDRTVLLALAQLVEAGLVTVERKGRRNAYTVAMDGQVQFGQVTMRVGDLVKAAEQDTQRSEEFDIRDT